MLPKSLLSSLAFAGSAMAAARSYSTYQPSLTEVEASAATAVTDHITSDVKGKVFDRYVIIWLENTDFDKAYDNDDMQALAKNGIVLSNYFGLSHPSQENYIGAVAGDYFGLGSDNFVELPANVSSVVDLLESKGISWSEYQEHMPYTGYEGFQFKNQETGANDYVRKHNPVASLKSVSDDPIRLANVKNFTEFYTDLDNKTLPQWMFITPNMTNDGHDTTIAVASKWSRDFLTPLLNNTYFMENTLILLTFDETETYSIPNRIYALLLGGVIDDSLKGTEDDTFYDHYSEITTVEDNWDLPHLGRYDVDSNVFQLVANKTGWENKQVDTTNLFNNQSYDGYLSDDTKPLPVPNVTAINQNGKGVLPEIAKVWGAAWSSEVGSSSSSALPSSSSPSASSVTLVSASSAANTVSTSSTSSTNGASSASKTSSLAATSASSTPLCVELGDDIEEFLEACSKYFGQSWKNQLTNPSSIRNPSTIPLCVIEQDGEKYLETILSYFQKLQQQAAKKIFHFAADTNATNSSSSSAAASSSTNGASNLGMNIGALFGALILLLQMI